MFTWKLLKKFRKVSSYYLRNILTLLKNEQLINVLLKKNLILYFSIHHEFLKYENIFKSIINIKNIIYIKEKDVAECLLKTNLLVSDFSSIIFDMIYRKKPFIIFIPDANDTNIENIYKPSNYNIIKNFSNNDFKFENVNFDINSTVNKIIYYNILNNLLNNNRNIESILKKRKINLNNFLNRYRTIQKIIDQKSSSDIAFDNNIKNKLTSKNIDSKKSIETKKSKKINNNNKNKIVSKEINNSNIINS